MLHLLLLFEVSHGEVDFHLNVGLVTFGGQRAHARQDTEQLTFPHVKIYELVYLEKGCFVSFSPERNLPGHSRIHRLNNNDKNEQVIFFMYFPQQMSWRVLLLGADI